MSIVSPKWQDCFFSLLRSLSQLHSSHIFFLFSLSIRRIFFVWIDQHILTVKWNVWKPNKLYELTKSIYARFLSTKKKKINKPNQLSCSAFFYGRRARSFQINRWTMWAGERIDRTFCSFGNNNGDASVITSLSSSPLHCITSLKKKNIRSFPFGLHLKKW